MAHVEFSLDGVLTNIQTTLELYVRDPGKYSTFIVNTLTNFVEILLKGFLIFERINQLPRFSSRRRREQRIQEIKNEYKGKYIHDITQEISLMANFSLKNDFLQVCEFFRRAKDDYRNEYTHEFFSYKMNVPFYIIRDLVTNFLDFLYILAENWSELKLKIAQVQKLKVLMYYIQFETKNSVQRWRSFNEIINRMTEEFKIYLGENFESQKKLIAMYELNISDDNDFCSKILGYDSRLVPFIVSTLGERQLTDRQIQKRLKQRGKEVQLRELRKILDDLSKQGIIQKRYEETKIFFASPNEER